MDLVHPFRKRGVSEFGRFAFGFALAEDPRVGLREIFFTFKFVLAPAADPAGSVVIKVGEFDHNKKAASMTPAAQFNICKNTIELRGGLRALLEPDYRAVSQAPSAYGRRETVQNLPCRLSAFYQAAGKDRRGR